MKKRADTSDTDAFAREMDDVVPLETDPRGRVRAVPPVRLPARPLGAPGNAARKTDGGPLDPGDLTSYAAAGVDRREIRKLKRGDHAVADRHDLHGMTAAEARASVKRFIENSRRKQHRCVCIVHGRGMHSAGNTPILKTRVREYLRSDPSVLAYADAPAGDGGGGAVYVLLRK